MSLVRTASRFAFAALALAACSRPADKVAGPAASAPGGAGGGVANAPQKDDMGPEIPASQMPVFRAGLWETTETSAGKKPNVERNCESGKQKPMAMGKECSKLTLHKTLLGKYVIDSQCGYGEMSVSLHMEAKGDFQSRYSLDTTSAIKMPGKPDQIDTSHREGRYVGPCPAGMDAGEE